MIKKVFFVIAIGLVAVVAALGLGPLGRGATPSRALIGIPIQPFAPDYSFSGLSNSQLGDTNTGGTLISNLVETKIPRGQRIAGPLFFSDAAYAVPPTMDRTVGAPVGDIIATLDALCDSPADGVSNDIMANTSLTDPWPWTATTTVVQGTPDAFLIPVVPPYPWLFRDTSDVTRFWIAGAPVTVKVVLNSVWTTVPWSVNGGADIVATRNGGDARAWSAATDGLCIDTPQDSTSHTTTNYAPPKLGDTGGPCSGGNCADAAVYGPTANYIQKGAGAVPVTSTYVNRGPNAGNFTAHWEIEVTNPSVADANWDAGGKTLDVDAGNVGGLGIILDYRSIAVTCPGTGEGLVVVKNVLWPVSPTQDYYPADNANVAVIKVVCGTDASPLVDMSVTLLKATHVTPTSTKPEQVTLAAGASATVTIRDVTTNNDIAAQNATQWLVAEKASTSPLTLSWGSATLPNGGTQTGVGTAATKIAGVSEPPGQSDIKDDLTIGCPASPSTTGRFSVVVKGIVAPAGESKPQDNAQRLVIMVNCALTVTADGKDDGEGIYPRWEIVFSNPDSRQSFASPPSFPSDTGPDTKLQQPIGGYIERFMQFGCYWHDEFGTCYTDAAGTVPCDGSVSGHPADGYIDQLESQQDYHLQQLGGIATVDPDGDCLELSTFAQPGHPVDLPDIAGTCDPVPWSMAGGPIQVTYTKAADHDCDGLPDGVEASWGSNPMVADTDNDGANDYVEMFDNTNPINTDTDADGFLDRPSAAFGDNTDKSQDNCPTVSNADGPSGNSQLNTDGKHRSVGASIPAGKASNPNKDKMGDACDQDNDNDGLPDAVEGVMGTAPKNFAPDGVTPSYDTDGDHCVDGSEVLTGSDPTLATSKCPTGVYFTLAMAKFFRACRWNLPILSTDTGGEAKFQQWDAKYSGNTDRAELDPDHDGVNCQTTDNKIGDKDNDSGPATYADVPDIVEIEGYNTNPANKDTDGDTCEDFVQINDLNGSGAVDTTDLLIVATYINKVPPAVDATSFEVIDVNKDLKINSSDLLQVASNTCAAKASAGNCGKTACKNAVY